MDWQSQLISVYLTVCKEYQRTVHIRENVARISNNSNLAFSDEEVITIYIFGVMDRIYEIKTIYEYAHRHLREWFPALPI